MAANRFATMIHRRTNRITLVLVYAFLEWSLIFFILLNSLFSYFILRFADYFGLKRPCLFCSRLDRFFDASGKSPSHRDLLCDDHALEISIKPLKKSKGFGESRFGKTASSCFPPIEPDFGIVGYSDTVNLIGDDVQIHNGKFFTGRSRSIFVLEEEEKVGSVHLIDSQEEETEEKLENDHRKEEENAVIGIVPQSPGKLSEEEEVSSDSTDDDDDEIDEEFSCYVSSFDCNREVTIEKEVDLAMEEADETAQETAESAPPPPKNLEFYIDDEDCHLIPVEFYKPSDEVREISDINGDFILDFGGAVPEFAAEDGGLIFPDEISAFASSPDKSKPDDSLQMQKDEEETDAEVSIGTEIPDHEQIGDIQPHEHIADGDDDDDDHEDDDDTLEFKTNTLETKRPFLNINEERLLETQNSNESSHSRLHNAMFHLDRRGSGTEPIDSIIECPEGGVLTVDKLKSELEEERKALNALYEELEVERSASAVAANETMAMINRLHEEKAAMQMEALQYQRMMEEQSEFDQEALQLLNELMVNREKENAELEKELELYRKRLEEYEAKEKMGMLRRRMRDSSVDSFRNNGDGDRESNGELQNGGGVSDWKFGESETEKNTPVDVVLRLDECLDDYEGERLSILGRLKFLEEKLTALNGEEEEEEEEEVNGSSINGNGHFHGKETNGKHRVIIKSKRLLPLFDAVDGDMENGNHQENGFDGSERGESVTVEEEVDELYERLEALEADREFLRHCVGSLRKGDKGVHLLHEILQHLRDLKNIDLIRVRENEIMSS
uniref:GTD-binding domain-containing protein n=1 Tax=Noccaea caerulescens TaxID=107243 RepID=A0A1J3HKA2_NOCCA